MKNNIKGIIALVGIGLLLTSCAATKSHCAAYSYQGNQHQERIQHQKQQLNIPSEALINNGIS